MRGLPPDVFEVRLHHNMHRDTAVVEIWSRMYDIRLGFELRRMWGDPRRLLDFAESFIGGTVHSWYENRINADSGREMARSLMPHWEREIHRRMERLEYEDMRRERMVRPFRGIELEHEWMVMDDFGPYFGPKEDPKATEKARQILMRNLDDGQLKSFKKDKEFRVTAKDGKTYTIKHARSFNVVGPDGAKYCGQLRDCPIEDQMLAQKLLLEHEPEKFFSNANVSPARDQRLAAPPRYMAYDWARL